MELLIARNPDAGSRLPFLLRLPLGDGLVFRTGDTWPRTSAVYCHPVPSSDWPAHPDVVDVVPLQACVRRGAAIDLVADRRREHRSQLVFTQARGRDVVFWQSPRTRVQSRADVRLPTARAAGVVDLQIIVDRREHYPYRFGAQQARTVRRSLACGDYAVEHRGQIVASVERKSLPDLVSSITSGRLRFAMAELAVLPRSAVVVEDRYQKVFKLEHVRPAVVADALAELQVRFPGVPIVFFSGRKMAEEWTYRYLAAALTWAATEELAVERIDAVDDPAASSRPGQPPTAEIRAWARAEGYEVGDRGRLRHDVVEAWRAAHAAQ